MIAEIVLQDSARGMDKLYEQLPNNIFEATAKALLEQPNNRNILLFTGFAIDGKQETDGPVGTYFLAKALFQLGYYPIIISDYYCKGYFDQADQNFETLLIPRKGFGQEFMYGKIIETYDPVAMISIERPGRSADGHYRNMKGELIDGQNAPLDRFFLEEVDVLTIGIGDGGNEIGMGKYHDLLITHLDYQHPCSISTDHCLIGTTSNWASYGLIAAIDQYKIPQAEALKAYYRYILGLGAIDAISGKSEYSVDGLPLSQSLEILKALTKK